MYENQSRGTLSSINLRKTISELGNVVMHWILFIISAEAWRPGKAEIVCPACGFKGQPLLRRNRGQVYKSALGIICTSGYDSYKSHLIHNLFNMAFGDSIHLLQLVI